MAFIMEGSRPLEMIASEANGGRSREAVRLTGSVPLIPGTFLAGEIGDDFTMATSPASVTAILLYHADPRDGGIDVAVLFRDCEVNDAYLVYGNMEPAAVNTALRERGIIVRRGVLVNPATEFATSRQPWPQMVPTAVEPPPNPEPTPPPDPDPEPPPVEPEPDEASARTHRRNHHRP